MLELVSTLKSRCDPCGKEACLCHSLARSHPLFSCLRSIFHLIIYLSVCSLSLSLFVLLSVWLEHLLGGAVSIRVSLTPLAATQSWSKNNSSTHIIEARHALLQLIICLCVFAGLAVGLDPQGYGNPDFCWLSVHDTLIWSFAGPIAVVVLVSAFQHNTHTRTGKCGVSCFCKRKMQHHDRS